MRDLENEIEKEMEMKGERIKEIEKESENYEDRE